MSGPTKREMLSHILVYSDLDPDRDLLDLEPPPPPPEFLIGEPDRERLPDPDLKKGQNWKLTSILTTVVE